MRTSSRGWITKFYIKVLFIKKISRQVKFLRIYDKSYFKILNWVVVEIIFIKNLTQKQAYPIKLAKIVGKDELL